MAPRQALDKALTGPVRARAAAGDDRLRQGVREKGKASLVEVGAERMGHATRLVRQQRLDDRPLETVIPYQRRDTQTSLEVRESRPQASSPQLCELALAKTWSAATLAVAPGMDAAMRKYERRDSAPAANSWSRARKALRRSHLRTAPTEGELVPEGFCDPRLSS